MTPHHSHCIGPRVLYWARLVWFHFIWLYTLSSLYIISFFEFMQSRPFLKDRKKFVQLVDPLLQGCFSARSVHHVVAVTAMCLQEQANFRPLIGDIVVALEYLASQAEMSENLKNLTVGSQPSPGHARGPGATEIPASKWWFSGKWQNATSIVSG